MKKVLFVASVVKIHIMVFHIPYLKWFKENGFEVHVAAKNDYENPSDLNIPYCDVFHNIDFSRNPLSADNIKAYSEMKRLFENNEFEIMHCHTPIGSAIARLAAKNSSNPPLKIVYTAHGFHFYNGAPLVNWLVYYPIEKYLSKYTDVIITINNEDYKRAQTFDAKEVVFVPGVGFDNKKVKKVKDRHNILKKELGINDNTLLILSVGELNKNKNHEIVIKALKQSNVSNYKYLICGEGPLKDHLTELINNLDMKENVQLMGFRSDVLEFYDIADIFVFPSFREGLSLSLMEAMSFGLPIIASNIRGNVDLIDENKGGYTFSTKNQKELEDLLKKIVSDSELRRKFGKYNEIKINNYSIDRVLNKVGNIYNNL